MFKIYQDAIDKLESNKLLLLSEIELLKKENTWLKEVNNTLKIMDEENEKDIEKSRKYIISLQLKIFDAQACLNMEK